MSEDGRGQTERVPLQFPSARANPSEHDYRAFMRAEDRGAVVDVVADQFTAWVRSRKDIDLNPSLDDSGAVGDRRADLLRHRTGGTQLVRARLAERVPTGRWDTEIIASDDGWVSIVVSNDLRTQTKVPQLARDLMQILALGDGSVQFRDEPHEWRATHVDTLRAVLTDPERRAPVFVVGTADHADLKDAFVERSRRWLRDVFGLAQAVVLDPEATEAARADFGDFGPKPWTIRTYLAGVDLASSVDARRHRFLGTDSLATKSDGAITALLSRVARQNAARVRDPQELLRARRVFGRLDVDATSSEVVASASPSSSTAPSLESAVRVDERPVSAPVPSTADTERQIREAITIEVGTRLERELRAEYDRRLAEVLRLERAKAFDDVNAFEDLLREQEIANEELQLESAELREERDAARRDGDRLERTVEFLRGRLRSAKDFDAAERYFDVEESNRPTTCAEALERLVDFEGIVFTGKHKDVQVVDDADALLSAAGTLWESILVLDGYRRARASGIGIGSVREYLDQRPSGYPVLSPTKHAPAETSATMQQFGADRRFAVPVEVDATGYATMEAHFKLARIGMISPRMHYFDDVARSGIVVIGYVGKHLRNTQTN